ncbi:MAG: FixH family protein [Anaerolineae bacterium]|nr:FixH family protein [Anaerolineae bacterium]
MTKKRYLWLILGITLLLMTGCRRGQTSDISDIGLDLSVSPNPPTIGPAAVVIQLTDETDQPLAGATVELEGNMSHAGMAPVFSQAKEVEPGRYEAPLEFTMGGDWFILVKATLPDGRQLERQVDVPGVETK